MGIKKGSVLILTLWTLSFLTIFSVALGRNVSGQLQLASHLQDRLKTYYLAKAGIERAIIELGLDESLDCDSLDETWANNEETFKELPLGEGYITVSYQLQTETLDEQPAEEMIRYGLIDENSRININTAPVQILQSMLENVGGLDLEEAADVANAIVDWRDKDIFVSPGGAESNYYEGLQEAYPCKDSRFEAPEELLLVMGMSPQIYAKIAEVITIYGAGKVNINTAGLSTFRALGLSKPLAERIIEHRQGKDEIDGTEDDAAFSTVSEIRDIGSFFTQESEEINRLTSLNILSVKSDVFRICSSGILKNGEDTFQRQIVCVVNRPTQKDPTKILYWYEQ